MNVEKLKELKLDEATEKFATMLFNDVETIVADGKKGLAPISEVEVKFNELQKQLNEKVGGTNLVELQKQLDGVLLDLKELKTTKPLVNETKSFGEQLKEKVLERKDAIKAGSAVSFEVDPGLMTKAGAVTMTIGDGVTGDVPRKVKLPDIFAPAGKGLWASGLIQEIPTTGNSVSITELYDEQGVPVFHNEKTASGQMSWLWREKNFKVKDVSAYTKFSKNMLDDIDNFIAQVQMLLMRRLAEKMDATMITGNETTNPEQFNGLATIATAWAAGGKKTYKPTEKDAIEVAIGQARSNTGYPNAIVINPTDLTNLLIAKAGLNNAILQYPAFDGTISGLQVVVSNNITAGKFIVLDSERVKLHVRTPYEITISNSADSGDFAKRLMTINVTKRAALVVSANDYGSIIYGDFSTAKTTLTLNT